MRTLVFMALAACAGDAGIDDVLYECSATFVCDGVPYAVTPTRACESGLDEARSRWQLALDRIAAQAQCARESFENSVCRSIGPCWKE